MTKEEFIDSIQTEQKSISEKYGIFMYFIISNIFNVNAIAKIVEDKGYKTTRVVLHKTAYEDILFKDKVIGRIECVASFPNIIFYKRNRKHAKVFAEYAIEPIKGVHRILDWHDIKESKLHCLAGGETVLHFLPVSLTEEKIDSFIKEMKLEPLVEHSLKNNDLKINF